MATKHHEFTRLIKDNKGIIYKVCNSYCADRTDRDDLAQDIIYNLWKSFDSFNDRFKFSTWMYRIALNVAISFYRQGKKFKNHDSISEGLIVFEESTDGKSEFENNLQLLQGFINELKEIDKAIILLYLDDKSHREIAEITGFTETNVATRINRIKDKLRTNFSNKVKNENHGIG
jgi:RNA polymerase sigma factor (sigma-70 family)